MICKECEKYWKIDTPGHGVCSLSDNFFPTTDETECLFLAVKEKTCKDCARFRNDSMCFGLKEDNPVNDCAGYIDKRKEQIVQFLFEMFIEGQDYKQVLSEAVKELESSEEYKFLKEKIEKRTESE